MFATWTHVAAPIVVGLLLAALAIIMLPAVFVLTAIVLAARGVRGLRS